MADARREHEYDVAMSVVGYLGLALAGTLDPRTANPYRESVPEPPKSPERRAEESRDAWDTFRAWARSAALDRAPPVQSPPPPAGKGTR